MIEHLTGKILTIHGTGLIIDVAGVGYGVEIPQVLLPADFANDQVVSLWIYTRVREDEIKLFGFPTRALRQTFDVLLQVSGVGPKVALGILCTVSLGALRRAIEEKDTLALEAVPGIGKRTAEKILLELQTKIERLALVQEETQGPAAPLLQRSGGELGNIPREILADLKSALTNLGFAERDFQAIIGDVKKVYRGQEFAELVRLALTMLNDRRAPRDEPESNRLNRLF